MFSGITYQLYRICRYSINIDGTYIRICRIKARRFRVGNLDIISTGTFFRHLIARAAVHPDFDGIVTQPRTVIRQLRIIKTA